MKALRNSLFAGVALLLLVALPLLGGTPVEAGQQKRNRLLKGDYAFTVTKICVVFDESDNFVNTNTAALRGIRRYDGHGTGVVEDGRIFQVSPGGGGSSTYTCDITYQVNPDRTTREEVTCTIPSVPPTTITGIVYEGQISRGHRTLLLTDIDNNVEDITSDGGDPMTRVCGRSGLAIKLWPGWRR